MTYSQNISPPECEISAEDTLPFKGRIERNPPQISEARSHLHSLCAEILVSGCWGSHVYFLRPYSIE